MTILLPFDGSPGADRAAALLAGFGPASPGLRVVVANVQTPPAAMWPELAADMSAVEAAQLAAGRAVADKAVARLQAAGLRAEGGVHLGFAADAIVRQAEARGAALIAMGTRGHGALRGFAVGSVAMRVAQASPLPVLLVRPDSKLPAQPGRRLRVMLAVDGSEPALRAAHALAAWRGWLGELDVQIVYVQPPLSYLETVLPPHDDVIDQWSTQAGENAARAARDYFAKENIRHHLHLTVGDPAAEIVHMAAQAGCELVAMGTRGLGAAHHAFIGSVALSVAAHAGVPVLLVK